MSYPIAPGHMTRGLSLCQCACRKEKYNPTAPDLPELVSSQLAEAPAVTQSASTDRHVSCPGPKPRVAAA